MGTELTDSVADGVLGRATPWLDRETAALVSAIVRDVARQCPELSAAVLFGSVARHDERPLGHANTSDVDLLLVVNACGDISVDQRLAIFRAIGSAYDLIVDAPREVQAMLATHDLAEGDPAFVANVARDGRVLFARGPLPPPLAHLAPVEHGA